MQPDPKERHMKTSSPKLKYVLPIIILAFGLVGMAGMVLSKTAPEKQEQLQDGVLVQTVALQAADYPVQIQATGTVQTAMSVNVVPQVSGRVVRLGRNFETGGFVKKGHLLFEIEADDYQLAAEKSRAEVANAEYELARVESQARVARLEWERVKLDDKRPPNPLVLYEPQLKNARAGLAGAKANVRQRMLDIGRTKIYAPFNCRISAKSVDPGQYVTAGQVAAKVAGTDVAEIVIPVPIEELQWLVVPRAAEQTGSPAQIVLNTGRVKHAWQGRIDRSLGEVDVQSRMTRLVVKVPDPYGLKQTDAQPMDLAEGLFVDVFLTGRTLEQVYAIPTSALRHQETLWMMAADGTLDILQVQVLRREKDSVLVRGALPAGQALVTTQVSGAAQGMRLRLTQQVQS
jgi:RND family efflux transporter MFP subunit